jgi:GNAT superfamily N-acetyltransferase
MNDALRRVTYRAKPNHRYVAMVGKRIVATAFVNDEHNFIQSLYVEREYRRQGIGSGLVRFIARHRRRKLNRCPNDQKNDAVRAMSAKLDPYLLEEAVVKRAQPAQETEQ